MSELDLLRGLGDQIVPPPLDDLRQTARGRDRRTTAALAAGSALVVTLATVLLLDRDTHSSPEPVGPPAPSSRPLTYAVGSEVHYGDQIVGTSGTVLELDLTDEGAVVRTDDAGIWFTDGSGLDRLGTLGKPGSLPTYWRPRRGWRLRPDCPRPNARRCPPETPAGVVTYQRCEATDSCRRASSMVCHRWGRTRRPPKPRATRWFPYGRGPREVRFGLSLATEST
jgi:hypothetical protein